MRCAVLLTTASACRFIAYLGEDKMSAEDLLLRGAHNLVTMATDKAYTPGVQLSPRWNASQFALRNVDENLDGFGVAWYVDGSDYARRIRSPDAVAPLHGDLLKLVRGHPTVPYMAMNNSCVSDTATKNSDVLRSRAMFGHVRAKSAGPLDRKNSHPFVYNTLTWMHNGGIVSFDAVKDRIRDAISTYGLVAGSTDSELAGAMFVDKLNDKQGPPFSLDALKGAMRATVKGIVELTEDHGDSSLNFAVTDGTNLVVSRYRSAKLEDPPTLYYKLQHDAKAIVVASEPLVTDPTALKEWTLLGKDRLLAFSPSAGLTIDCIDPETCDQDLSLRFKAI